jgi:hypothetical protein
MSIASLGREGVDGIPTGRYCDGWREVWRSTDPVDPLGDGSYVWERAMPRLTDDILECSIYLYRNHIEADRGENTGGSGFLYEIPFDESASQGKGHLYAVSNTHVVSKAPVIRLNSSGPKGHKIVRKRASEWFPHPDKHTDISVCPLADDLRADDQEVYKYRSIGPAHLVTKERIIEFNIGIADDAFLVGRFVNHDGRLKNQPSVRLGAIAQMPIEEIKTETGMQEAFLVEVKSIAGYSGSPVFALISDRRSSSYKRTIESMRGDPQAMLLVQAQEVTEWFMFLGVDCGHIIDCQSVYNAEGTESGHFIKSNTGMAVVIVPWKLTELLESPILKKKRDEALRLRQGEIVVAEDFAEKPARKNRDIPIPPVTRKKFFTDLGKATQKKTH